MSLCHLILGIDIGNSGVTHQSRPRLLLSLGTGHLDLKVGGREGSGDGSGMWRPCGWCEAAVELGFRVIGGSRSSPAIEKVGEGGHHAASIMAAHAVGERWRGWTGGRAYREEEKEERVAMTRRMTPTS
jgi:hypothetical protein